MDLSSNLFRTGLVIVLFFATNSLVSQDFRKSTWGMSPSQVKSTESNELLNETAESLIYETTLAGYGAWAIYVFVEGKLVRAKYVLTESHPNNNDYIPEYYRLNTFLKKKYGDPLEEEVSWKGDSYFKDDESTWGNYISRGELVLYSTYSNLTTSIYIVLAAEDYEVSIQIEYSSLNANLKNLEEEKMLEDF